MNSVPPPSEPDRRISRIRLSSRWFTSERIDRLNWRPSEKPTPFSPGRAASWHPHEADRQHASRPERQFGAGATRSASFGRFSLSALAPEIVLPHSRSASTFLRSLRSRPVTALRRYYGRSDSCSLRRGSARVISRRPPDRLLREQVSLIHALGLPTIPSPTTCGCSASPGHVTYRRVEPRVHPYGTPPNGNSGLRPPLADSPHHTGRIEFVILRTSRSPPAALHLASQRPSCSRLQVIVDLDRTFASLTKCALRRTSGGL